MSAVALSQEPGSAPAAVLSVLVHAMLFAFLFLGVRWASKAPDAVVVELWDRPAEEQIQPQPPKAEPQPEPKVEPKVEPKPEPKVEPKVEHKPVKPDIVVEKQKKVPPKKEEPKLKIDRDSAIREELARDMEQVSRERERRAAASKSLPAAAGAVIDPSYANLIKARIKSNIVLPPDLQGNPEAIFDVVQLPTGEVLSARLRKSSGHKGYDDAVERAILKSSPLPRPNRPDQFMRELQLKFRPQE